MHESGCFVIPNPWDIGSAVYLRPPRFQGTRYNFCGLRILPRLAGFGQGTLARCSAGAYQEIAAATPLPVNADFQSGYADDPAESCKKM